MLLSKLLQWMVLKLDLQFLMQKLRLQLNKTKKLLRLVHLTTSVNSLLVTNKQILIKMMQQKHVVAKLGNQTAEI